MDNDFKELEKYFNKAKSNKIEFEGYCHDCKKLVKVKADVAENGELTISGGAIYFPEIESDKADKWFCKCDTCYEKDNTLRDYQPCDVYSRVVGFCRPVKYWNKGKQAEFINRKEYNLPQDVVLQTA